MHSQCTQGTNLGTLVQVGVTTFQLPRHQPVHSQCTQGIDLGAPCRYHNPPVISMKDAWKCVHVKVVLKSERRFLNFWLHVCCLQVARLLEHAARNRAVAATHCNERSSRSHSVFRLKLSGSNGKTGETCEGTHVVFLDVHMYQEPITRWSIQLWNMLVAYCFMNKITLV